MTPQPALNLSYFVLLLHRGSIASGNSVSDLRVENFLDGGKSLSPSQTGTTRTLRSSSSGDGDDKLTELAAVRKKVFNIESDIQKLHEKMDKLINQVNLFWKASDSKH